MKWFKHDSDANQDAKLQNVLLDYGLEGYGLYWYCIELIAGKINQDNLSFELEHDARIIARNTGCTVQKVEEMMRYFVAQNLFDNAGGTVKCLNLLKRLDQSMTSNNGLRKAITQLKDGQSHDKVMTESCKNRIEKKRREENRKDISVQRAATHNEKNIDIEQFEKVWRVYPTKVNKKKSLALWLAYLKKSKVNSVKFADHLVDDIQKRCDVQQFGFDKLHFTTYINNHRWADPVYNTSNSKQSHDLIDNYESKFDLNEGNDE